MIYDLSVVLISMVVAIVAFLRSSSSAVEGDGGAAGCWVGVFMGLGIASALHRHGCDAVEAERPVPGFALLDHDQDQCIRNRPVTAGVPSKHRDKR